MQQNKNKSPIFIVGAGRSGTTLLRQILNCHPSLAIVPESHFISWFYYKLHVYGDLHTKHNAITLINDIVSTDRFQKWSLEIGNLNDFYTKYKPNSYRSILESLYYEYAYQQGKARWGDKTPAYVEELNIILTLFPDAKIIHVVRDGRDVYLSHKKVPWGPKTAETAAVYWVNCLQKISNCEQLNSKNLLEVRYEDLVTTPKKQLTCICNFIDEKFYPYLLNYQDHVRDDVRHWKSQYFNKKITAQTQKYLSQMPRRKVRSFERIASKLLEKYGYKVHTPKIRGYSSSRVKLFMIVGRLLHPLYSRLNNPDSRIGSLMRTLNLHKLLM